ncbi:MAG: manganese catalase family protein [Tepidanaerobacteraceae bacterium]|nr:manganese catalase family protein [Tepidanaerobacteraceae bacterium]
MSIQPLRGPMVFNSREPYPAIAVERPNREYAEILMGDYAGRDSELTAILQYVYGNLVVANTDVARLLMGISRVEMHHLHMLGETIKLLGVDPRYQYLGKYWNAGFVNYERDMCRILRINREGELVAIQEYKRQAAGIDDEYVKKLLLRIARDEEVHARLLGEAMEKYCK